MVVKLVVKSPFGNGFATNPHPALIFAVDSSPTLPECGFF